MRLTWRLVVRLMGLPSVLSQAACVGAVVQIDVGGSSSCAVRGGGSVWCWGMDQSESTDERCQYVEDAPLCHRHPTRIDDLPAARTVSVGESFSCVATTSDEVFCWGSPRPDAPDAESDEPTRVSGLPDIAEVVAAHHLACALDHGGQVWCWGSQFGLGLDGETPKRMPLAPGVVQLEARGQKICALTKSNRVACWGYNGDDGYISTNLGESLLRPTIVPELDSAEIVTTFKHRNCAVLRDGTARCGRGEGVDWIERTLNGLGPLAFMERGAVLTRSGEVWRVFNNREVAPTRVGTGAEQLSMAEFHYCYLTRDHRVFCGGNNEYAQLGAGDIERASGPRAVVWK